MKESVVPRCPADILGPCAALIRSCWNPTVVRWLVMQPPAALLLGCFHILKSFC